MCAWQPSGVTQGFVLCIPSWVAEWLSLWVCFAFPRQPSGVARGVVHPVVSGRVAIIAGALPFFVFEAAAEWRRAVVALCIPLLVAR